MAVLPRLPVSTSRRLHAGAAVSPSRGAAISVDIEITQFNAALERYLRAVPQDVGTAVETLAFDLERRVKQRTPVDTGRARASWHTRLSGARSGYSYRDRTGQTFDGTLDTAPASPLTGVIEAIVGSNVEYMCVSSITNVWTEKGPRRISKVRVGDRVMTQDGTYRRVLRVWSFPTTKKPDLVDVTIEWRAGRGHQKLTLTVDHKVLVRVGGVMKWMPAGDLDESMEVWTPRKRSHRKGVRALSPARCMYCRAEIAQAPSRRRIFCSNAHRGAYWSLGHSPHTGTKRSETARHNIRVAVARQTHKINVLAALTRPTSAERAVEQWLTGAGLAFNRQVLIKAAGAIADFEVPALRLIVEADGTYWHRDQAADIERDKRILAVRQGWQILHFHFAEPRIPVTLEPEPVPGTHYIVCNPGIKSLCDAGTFRPTRITSLRQYRYEPPARTDWRGTRPALLWDLEVEGMHSFVANGLVVSNSSLEAGHSRQAPQGMLRVSVAEMRGELDRAVERVLTREGQA